MPGRFGDLIIDLGGESQTVFSIFLIQFNIRQEQDVVVVVAIFEIGRKVEPIETLPLWF